MAIKDTVTILKFSQISVLFLKRYFLESNVGYNYFLSRIDNYWGWNSQFGGESRWVILMTSSNSVLKKHVKNGKNIVSRKPRK